MKARWQIVILLVIASVLEGTNALPPVRVVGGEEAKIGELPYLVALKKKVTFWISRHMCGGTIIGKRHVLTAAHCIDGVSENPQRDISVVTGSNTISYRSGVRHEIKTVTIHPDYSEKQQDGWRNDLAVIALTEDIEFNSVTRPLPLPEVDTADQVRCVASGWGDLSYPNGAVPTDVRKTGMTTVTNQQCKVPRSRTIHDTHLCAYERRGVGLCVGDSGGPLACNGTIAGIASWVSPCGLGVPDVFTRVFAYRNFILEAMATT